MTTFPWNITRAQRMAFEAIATGDTNPRASSETITALVDAGLIAPGDVDERDIQDVRPDDLIGYTQCHFFAGIGVWSYALRSAGWPDDRPVWTGSCPCQPFSAAGKGGGFTDERHLWPAQFHLIRECRPVIWLGEQVASKDGLAWLDLVSADLEGEGYACGAVDTCSAGFGAPHIRQRLRIAAQRLDEPDSAGRSAWWQGSEAVGHWRSAVSGSGFGGLADALRNRNGPEPRDSGGPQGKVDVENGSASWLGAPVRIRSAVGGLADTMLTGRPEGRPITGGGSPPWSGGIGGLADAEHSQWRPLDLNREDGRDRQDCGREEAYGVTGTRSEVLGLADADDTGSQGWVGGRDSTGERAARAGGVELQEQPGPVNGFWRAADWLFCRDGKWRPVSPKPQPLVDGSAISLGRVRHEDIQEFEEEVNAWAMESKIDRGQALRDLFVCYGAEAQSKWAFGRIPGLHEAPFLLSFLRQLTEQGWAKQERLPVSCAEVREAVVRSVWGGNGTAGTSRQRGLEGQQAREYSDALLVLSSILARRARKTWGVAYDAYAETAHPLTIGAANRMGRLRGFGNAVDAEATRAFIEAVMAAQGNGGGE